MNIEEKLKKILETDHMVEVTGKKGELYCLLSDGVNVYSYKESDLAKYKINPKTYYLKDYIVKQINDLYNAYLERKTSLEAKLAAKVDARGIKK